MRVRLTKDAHAVLSHEIHDYQPGDPHREAVAAVPGMRFSVQDIPAPMRADLAEVAQLVSDELRSGYGSTFPPLLDAGWSRLREKRAARKLHSLAARLRAATVQAYVPAREKSREDPR